MENKKTLSVITAGVLSLAMCGTLVSTSILESQEVEAVSEMSAIELVDDMGLGWNLGNTFDSNNITWGAYDTPEGIETGWGNPVTTKNMISTIHDYGFDSIRIPITWAQMMSSDYTINEDYLARIKEVIDWCYEESMYVIINTHHDDLQGNWLSNAKNDLTTTQKNFETVWNQIAEYFADYDNHLVFEGMNEPDFGTANVVSLNQTFVDTVRATGGNNADRLLLISAPNTDLTTSLKDDFTVPDDDMLAVSIHYYLPSTFCVAEAGASWGYASTWGTALEKAELLKNFDDMKSKFMDNGIPVILGEYGVLTEPENGKDHDSIVDFLTTVAKTSQMYEGIASFLWDSSNAGDMNYFNRKELTFFDSEIGQMYIDVSGSEYKQVELGWVETPVETDEDGIVYVPIGNATKVRVEASGLPNSSGIGVIGFWDNNANDGKGAWDQSSIHIRFDADANGNVIISQTDADGEETLHEGYFEIPTGSSTDSIQVQFWYGGYDDNGSWTDLASDEYPTLTKAYVPGIPSDVDTSTSDDDTTTTTSEPDVTDGWIKTDIVTDDKGVVSVNVGNLKYVKLNITGTPSSSGTGAIGYWDNSANGGKGAWVQNTIYIRFDIDEDGNGVISQTDSEYETVINEGFIQIPESADTDSIQVMYFYGGYVDEDGNWNDMTSDQYPTLSEAFVAINAPDVTDIDDTTTSEPDDTTTPEPDDTTTPDPDDTTTPEPDDTTTPDPDDTTTSGVVNPDVLLGDVNGDGSVKSNDLLLLKKYLLGLAEDDEINKINADVTQDGDIKSNDLLLLKKYLLGLEDL